MYGTLQRHVPWGQLFKDEHYTDIYYSKSYKDI